MLLGADQRTKGRREEGGRRERKEEGGGRQQEAGGSRNEAERPGATMGAMKGHLCVTFSVRMLFQKIYVLPSHTLKLEHIGFY